MEKSTTQSNDIHKMLEQFKLPGVDVASILATQRKNIEALTEANKLTFEGMQSLVQKQVDILRNNMGEVQSAIKIVMASGKPIASTTEQTELALRALQQVLENMRALSEVAWKSRSDALDVINKRVKQNIEDLRGLLQPQ